jgi:hypothetical protein
MVAVLEKGGFMAAQANGKTPLSIEAARFPVVIHPRQRYAADATHAYRQLRTL